MTIGHALKFIQQGRRDSDLRARLNKARTLADLNGVLESEGLVFSPHDFDEAYHNQLFQCQFEEDADEIKEFKAWWDLVSQSVNLAICGPSCGGGCC